MPDPSLPAVPGRALVSRRALAEIVRDAVLGSYGVTRLKEPTLLWRIRAALRLGSGSVRIRLQPEVEVGVWVTVAFGLPVAEVARQIDSAVRYGLRRALGRDVGPISVHVEGLAGRPFVSKPAASPAGAGELDAAAAGSNADHDPGAVGRPAPPAAVAAEVPAPDANSDGAA